MEAAGDGERSSFRCLHAARYVLAAVMTVLVATITFNTVKMVLYEQSHDPVQVSVARGAVVFARRTVVAGAAGVRVPAVAFYYSFRVSSARGFKYYAAINKTCLFQDDGTWWPDRPDPDDRHAIVCFRPGRTVRAVEQRGQSYFLMEAEVTRDAMDSDYFDDMYHGDANGNSLAYAGTLRLEGAEFVAERRSGRNTTSRSIIYHCKFLTVSRLDGDEVELLDHRYDTPCQ